jgi:hypothetical protein
VVVRQKYGSNKDKNQPGHVGKSMGLSNKNEFMENERLEQKLQLTVIIYPSTTHTQVQMKYCKYHVRIMYVKNFQDIWKRSIVVRIHLKQFFRWSALVRFNTWYLPILRDVLPATKLHIYLPAYKPATCLPWCLTPAP